MDWSKVWDSITGFFKNAGDTAGKASSWMNDNKGMTNLIGNTLMGVGGYFAQKEASKALMKQQREILKLQDQMKAKYSAVPDVDFSYNSLTVDDAPNLANGGILTEMKKRSDYERRGM